MKRVLLAGFKQETSSFNPTPTHYDDFIIQRGDQLTRDLSNTDTEFAAAFDTFANQAQVIPTYAACSITSGGPVATPDLDRLIDELVDAVRPHADADGAYIVFHGAMAGADEVDPEGRVLARVRQLLGDKPIVISLDLHGILTDRLVENADVINAFHTYPHIDQYDTGARAARNLLRLLDGAKPAKARIKLPMLVRGDELITATGLFGEAIRTCQAIEASEGGLAASVLIGNPFTDVPDLRSNTLVYTDGDPQRAQQEAEELARFMWHNRQRLIAPLKSVEEAIAIAAATDGLTVFSDAADATSSGAPGDGNGILKGLLASDYPGKALLPLVDAPAVARAFAAGVGATFTTPLGATLDTERHTPVETEVYVKALADGDFLYEDATQARAGQTAVLVAGNATVLITSRPVNIMGRRVFECHGLNPQDFDVVVCKSPNGFRAHYESIAAAIVPVDVPGATSANLKSLPFQHCARPTFPLDADVPPPVGVNE